MGEPEGRAGRPRAPPGCEGTAASVREVPGGGRAAGRGLWAVMVAGWLALAPAPAALGAPALFPVEQVRPGLAGYGLTVVEGTRIDRFDVEVLGVVPKAGPAGDLILVRVSGPALEPFGGIAAGMSGSPVYIDGRLLGAIGFAFEMSDHSVGMVTPIGDMLEVLRRVPESSAPGASAAAAGPYRHVAFAADEASALRLRRSLPPDTAVMVPVATPVMLSGFGPRAQRAVQRLLAPFGLMLVPGGGAAAGGPAPEGAAPAVPLEPGSAFGVALVDGDVSLTAIGTITYVEGDRFVGFGHPFLQKGQVDFFAGPAFIHRTVSSLSVPFKVGSLLGAPNAVLTEDRRAAVAGRMGAQPDAIRLSVTVDDLSTGRSRTLQARIVRDDLLTVPLVAIASLEALDRGLDRIGPGTARTIYRIQGRGLPGPGVFARDAVDYSATDVSARLLGDFLGTLQTLVTNRFQDIGLTSVDLRVQVTQARQTAAIVRARPLASQVRPGERVGVEVELLPFRGQPETRILTLEIPPDAAPGTVSVTVRGGSPGSFSLAADIESLLTGQGAPSESGSTEEPPPEQEEVPTSLQKLIEMLEDREKSNELVAEFYPGVSPSQEGDAKPSQADPHDPGRTARLPGEGSSPSGKASKEGTQRTGSGAVKRTLITPWVIEGSTSFDVEILEPEAQPSPGAGDDAGSGAAPLS